MRPTLRMLPPGNCRILHFEGFRDPEISLWERRLLTSDQGSRRGLELFGPKSVGKFEQKFVVAQRLEFNCIVANGAVMYSNPSLPTRCLV